MAKWDANSIISQRLRICLSEIRPSVEPEFARCAPTITAVKDIPFSGNYCIRRRRMAKDNFVSNESNCRRRNAICELSESDNKVHRRFHMRHLLLFVSVLLLGLSWAAAQDSASPTSASGQTSSAGGETTVQGCLTGASGSFTLTDQNGTTYQLTGDTAKLSEHVGHEVKISGATSSASAPSSAEASGTAGGSNSGQTLQVSSVKHISKTCQSAGSTAK